MIPSGDGQVCLLWLGLSWLLSKCDTIQNYGSSQRVSLTSIESLAGQNSFIYFCSYRRVALSMSVVAGIVKLRIENRKEKNDNPRTKSN